MVNYQNSKIYKLWSDESDCLYIGSTTQPLHRRLSEHMSDMKSGRRCTSTKMREHSNIRIELVEKFPCDSKEDLVAREGHYIRVNRDSVLNKYIAGRTDKEYETDNREKIIKQKKEYYVDNRESIRNQRKDYRET